MIQELVNAFEQHPYQRNSYRERSYFYIGLRVENREFVDEGYNYVVID